MDEKFYTLKDWPHQWPSYGGLRWLAFNRRENGFEDAFVKVGGRLFVDEQKFFECMRLVGRHGG